MKIIHETDTLVFGQEEDQTRALGLLMMLSTMSVPHSQSQAFLLVERFRDHIIGGHYGIFYERSAKDGVVLVPVGFLNWAKLSRQAEIIYTSMFRPLRPDELESGKHLWIVDIVAPLGHAKDLQLAFGATIGKGHPKINIARSKDGNSGRLAVMANLAERMQQKGG